MWLWHPPRRVGTRGDRVDAASAYACFLGLCNRRPYGVNGSHAGCWTSSQSERREKGWRPCPYRFATARRHGRRGIRRPEICAALQLLSGYSSKSRESRRFLHPCCTSSPRECPGPARQGDRDGPGTLSGILVFRASPRAVKNPFVCEGTRSLIFFLKRRDACHETG